MPLPILIPAVFLTATLSGIIGMGGGVILVAVMAAWMEPFAVVPLHGVIQLVSNSSRSLVLLRNVAWWVVALYAPPLLLGVAVGTTFYRGAGMPWFRPLIGAFVLAFLLWDRFKPARLQLPRWLFVPAGFIGGVVAVLVGASGPYLAAFFLRDDLERRQVVATKAAVQTIGHLAKIPAFLAIGFDYAGHWRGLVPLAVCAAGGTFVGTRVLGKLHEGLFRKVFRLALAILAVRLITSAWW